MREIHRPIHSGFETLRLRRQPQQRDAFFNRQAFPAFEQLTALGLANRQKPSTLYDQRFSR